MNKIEKKCAAIGLREYIKEYRNVDHFLTFCHECDGFAKTWACPPFEKEESYEEYNYANIFGYKILIEQQLQEVELTPAEFAKKTREILSCVREDLDEYFLQLEREVPASRALFGGSCRVCPLGQCTRPKGEACIHPDKMRPSIEAMGFDVARSTSQLLGINLKWGTTHLPEYFTLVYALFSKEPLSNTTW